MGIPFSLYAWLPLNHYPQFLFFQPFCQMDKICGMDSKEDVKELCCLPPGLDTVKIIMLLLCPERAFHRSGHDSCKSLSHNMHPLAGYTQGGVCLLAAFPQQFHICRITHLTLIARRICVHCVQNLHVRLPFLRQGILQL